MNQRDEVARNLAQSPDGPSSSKLFEANSNLRSSILS